jgi:hypothetical protein
MLEFAINNETIERANSLSLLTFHPSNKEMSVMAKSNIAKPVRICQVPGCDGKHDSHGYCGKHNMQIKRLGKVVPRTNRDRNEIVIKNGIAHMLLYDTEQKIIAETIIDVDVLDDVNKHKWRLSAYGYVFGTIAGKCVYLSRYLMEPIPDGMEIDHINRDTLDNRMSNLRYATKSQNSTNSVYKNTKRFRGVYWVKGKEKWKACIRHKNVNIHIGYFRSEKAAARAYNEKAMELHGEFATLNKV